jgi:hypothetical protein
MAQPAAGELSVMRLHLLLRRRRRGDGVGARKSLGRGLHRSRLSLPHRPCGGHAPGGLREGGWIRGLGCVSRRSPGPGAARGPRPPRPRSGRWSRTKGTRAPARSRATRPRRTGRARRQISRALQPRQGSGWPSGDRPGLPISALDRNPKSARPPITRTPALARIAACPLRASVMGVTAVQVPEKES